MRKLVILGGGTAGTIMLDKLTGALDPDEWQITLVNDTETQATACQGAVLLPGRYSSLPQASEDRTR